MLKRNKVLDPLRGPATHTRCRGWPSSQTALLMGLTVEQRECHAHPVEVCLDRTAAQRRIEVLRHSVAAINGQQLRLQALAVDPCTLITGRARDRTAPERAVDVD